MRMQERFTATAVVGLALLTDMVSGFLSSKSASVWSGGRICGGSSSSSGRGRSHRPAVSMVGQLLNRGDKPTTQTDKAGFPVGDPRAKGGTELDVGLQVGPLMWRWPTVWPYPDDFFSVSDNATTSLEYFAGPLAPTGAFVTGEKLGALQSHFDRHLPAAGSDTKVLDLGAGAQTLLPLAYTPGGGIVGIGASEDEMKKNDRLSERVVLDLNDPDTALPFSDKTFDVVVCTATMEYLTEPRATFREVYRVLKEGGMAIVAFTSKGSYQGGETKQANYWNNADFDFNDAKKLYMAGSFFQFSAGGWSQLKGYRLWSAEEEGGANEGGLLDKLPFGNKDAASAAAGENGLYVVSSVRAELPNSDAGPLRTMQAGLWETKYLLPDERRLCCERLHAQWKACGADEAGQAEAAQIVASAAYLEDIYEALEPMKLKVLPVPIVAMLAANLAPAFADPGADRAALMEALKEGLGLSPPQETFWKPLGALTKDLIAEEKIWLLVDFVPFFATPEKAARLQLVPGILEQAIEAVQGIVTDLEPVDAQLLAADLTITDFLLKADDPDGAPFLTWLNALAPFQLRDILEERKAFDGSAR